MTTENFWLGLTVFLGITGLLLAALFWQADRLEAPRARLPTSARASPSYKAALGGSRRVLFDSCMQIRRRPGGRMARAHGRRSRRGEEDRAVSRPVWHIHLRAELVNGTAGVVEITARDMIALKEVRGQLAKLIGMCEHLQKEPEVAEEARPFKIVS